MAANLQSFQSNDKQMQAIRELTNEVFNLKQRQVTAENDILSINTGLAEKCSAYVIVSLYSGTIEAGATTPGITIQIPSQLEGVTPVSAFFNFAAKTGGNVADGVVACRCSIAGTPPAVAVRLTNTTEEDITLQSIIVTLLYV